MTKKSKYQKAKKEVHLRKQAGMPNWLIFTFSFIVPIYGVLYYFISKDYDRKKAREVLFFAIIGILVILIVRLIAWIN